MDGIKGDRNMKIPPSPGTEALQMPGPEYKYEDLVRENMKLVSENTRLRKALEPFKRFADRLDSPPNWVPDGCPINTDSGGISDFCVGDLRRARAALAPFRRGK